MMRLQQENTNNRLALVNGAGVFVAVVMAAPAYAGSGGSITFGPGGAQSVPALGTTMAALLAMMVAFAATVALKRRAGTLNAIVALLATATLLGTLGMPLIDRAVGAGMTFLITQSGGQTLPITQNDISSYENTSGVPVTVLSVNLPMAPNCGPASEAINDPFECGVGSTIENGSTCQVDCTTGAIVSDRRLKEDVVRVGTAPNGLPLYHFRYIGRSEVYEGVMAQDVMQRFPDAVVTRDDGYLVVYYGALGMQMRQVRPQ